MEVRTSAKVDMEILHLDELSAVVDAVADEVARFPDAFRADHATKLLCLLEHGLSQCHKNLHDAVADVRNMEHIETVL